MVNYAKYFLINGNKIYIVLVNNNSNAEPNKSGGTVRIGIRII